VRQVTVCAVQSGPCGADRESNVAFHLERVERAAREHAPDVVLLSELALSPYFCVVTDQAWFDLAEPIPGPSTQRFGEVARRHRIHLILPIFERAANGVFYNSAAVIGPDGALVPGRLAGGETAPCYRKAHIPASRDAEGRVLNHEKAFFTPGPGLPTFDLAIGRIGILICYDKRFLEAWRALVLGGAEIIFVPNATWGVDPAIEQAAEMQVLARYNQVFVVTSWKAGIEDVGFAKTFGGGAQICGPAGDVIATAPSQVGHSLAATIDLEHVGGVRARRGLLRDRRPELYRVLTDAPASIPIS
jgi:N-carbamoylputrescine amidase